MKNILTAQQVGIDFFTFESIEDSEYYCQSLSLQEQEKAAQLKFPDVRQQFVLTRGRLRYRLAEQLSCQPEDLIIEYHAKGKPYLKNFNYQFNVSHTRGAAVIAISPDIQLGVDIEDVNREVDIAGVAKHIFTQQEQDFILNHRDSKLAFFLCWTRKEAFIKAHGAGMYSDFKTIPTLTNNLSTIDILDNEQQKWFIQDWKTIDQYRIALATNKIINQIVCLRTL